MKKPFKPSQEQIKAAQNLMLAMAHLQLVEPIVRGYQREILERHQWHICPTMADVGREQEVITDPKRAYMLADADAAVYYALCDEAKQASGLKLTKPENCPLLEAEGFVLDARRALVAALEPITGVTWDKLMRNFSELPRYIELSLKLMAPFVGQADAILKDLVKKPPSA